jgi:hypothetical protein
MTDARHSDEDRVLDEALDALAEPELPTELLKRLEAIPERGNVRRFPGRSWRVSAVGWALAAAIGLFIGTQTAETESVEAASNDNGERIDANGSDDEDETVALAVGSFTDFEEEP